MERTTSDAVDAYIAAFPPEVAAVLQRLRQTIAVAAPAATQTISYKIGAFLLDGEGLIYFAGWKKHVSLYPVPHGDRSLSRKLAPYQAGKGTLKFPLDKPVPYDLVTRIVAARLKEM